MIRISRLTKRFGASTAVDDVSLTVAAGDSLALWGTNGAGKTTLLRCLLGLLHFRGTVSIGGRDVRAAGKAARQLVGYVPQELGFHDDLGVAETVRFFARLKALGAVDVHATLRCVGLDGDGHKRVRELSGGMKQRLALAIALLAEPPVLLLDEVTASLDAVGREEFVGLLKQLAGAGRTLLFASHRIEEVATLARRVARLERGRLVGVSSSAEFLDRFGHYAHLHLIVAADHRSAALQTLAAGGFAPQLNGVGVIVPVMRDHKAVPFKVLAEARIPVLDFELVSVPRFGAPDNAKEGRTQ